jgi:DNA-binding response OmpR family regulator
MRTAVLNSAPIKVLLVEDDSLDVQHVIKSLPFDRFKVMVSATFKDALLKASSDTDFDFCILDGRLPDGDGLELCRLLRASNKNSTLPILMLTGRSDVGAKVAGFSCGADDYLCKPFDALELKARVEALLRRSQKKSDSFQTRIGPLLIDSRKQRAFYVDQATSQEVDLQLSQTEFRCLDLLASNEGQVFSREQILESVWGNSVHVCDRNVDSFVSRLRKKNGLNKFIKSRYGLGYVFSLSE